MTRKRKVNENASYCYGCRKVGWSTVESATAEVRRLRQTGVRKQYLLNSYRCPLGVGWHIGHNYNLQWNNLCIDEHK